MQNIVILDGHTLNPGDLSWEALAALGRLQVHDRTPEAEVAARAAEADILLTNKAIINEAAIAGLPRLKYIGVMATGYNVVNIAAAKARNIPVTNVPAYGTLAVAQLTFALILELCNNVGLHAASVREGEWERNPDFCYWKTPLVGLQNKVLGIVGLGQIGQAVARIALAFGMKVIAYHKHPDRDRMEGVTYVDQATCFAKADIVSLHCPLNEQNRGFVNRALLETMQPHAFLVNTSRGPLIREQDLADALNNHVIAGAGLDVLSVEPPAAGNPLIGAANCFITPHIAWATRDARQRLLNQVVENIRAFQSGKVINSVY